MCSIIPSCISRFLLYQEMVGSGQKLCQVSVISSFLHQELYQDFYYINRVPFVLPFYIVCQDFPITRHIKISIASRVPFFFDPGLAG